MEEDDEDKLLLNSLGVTSVAPEAIERKLFLQVRNDDKSESSENSEEHDLDREHEVTDPSSTSCAKLYSKLQAIDVEISAVASSITEEKSEVFDDNKSKDDVTKSIEPVQLTPDGLSLHQALAKDRLRSLQRTKARLQKEISHFEEQASASSIEHEELLDNLVKEKPKHRLKHKISSEQSNRHSKSKLKIVGYDEDADFDAVLDAASAGFVETEREELIRKGKLTPFHKIKGFERRVEERPGPSNQNEAFERASNENFVSSSIAKAARSLEDIARNRPSTKLLGFKALPALDPPARPFQRLKRPPKVSPNKEDHPKRRPELAGKLKRPSPDKKWRKYDLKREDFPDGNEGDSVFSDYEIEGQEEAADDEEQSCVVLEGGLKMPNSVYMNLFDYQKVGVQWLWELHCQRAGGIIGDEMGLGKTIQVKSLFLDLSISAKCTNQASLSAPLHFSSNGEEKLITGTHISMSRYCTILPVYHQQNPTTLLLIAMHRWIVIMRTLALRSQRRVGII